MDWVWLLYEKYLIKRLVTSASPSPSEEELQAAFIEALSRTLVTILVQEPWRGSVRFKCLDKAAAYDRFDLLENPEAYLIGRFGGGKFKLNFHDGWNFVATQNFKPAGEPLWTELPDFDEEVVV